MIGNTVELKKLDELRHRIKLTQGKRSPELSAHDRLLASIQLKVLREQSSAMKKTSSIEHLYFQQHGTLPSDGANQDIAALMSKCKTANKLLKFWNVSL